MPDQEILSSVRREHSVFPRTELKISWSAITFWSGAAKKMIFSVEVLEHLDGPRLTKSGPHQDAHCFSMSFSMSSGAFLQ